MRRANGRKKSGDETSGCHDREPCSSDARILANSLRVFRHHRAMLAIGNPLNFATLRDLSRGGVRLSISETAYAAIERGAAAVAQIVKRGEPAYGVNTGFGRLAQTHIPNDQLELLQTNLVLSHAVGVGAPLPASVVRLTLALKIATLARGYLGRAPRAHRRAGQALQRRRAAAHPVERIGGRERRSRAARAPVGRVVRRGRSGVRRQDHERRRRPEARRAHAHQARRQGRPRAAERHADLDRARAGAISSPSTISTPPRSWPARCRWTRPKVRRVRSMRASTSCAVIPGRSPRRRPIASCSRAARSTRAIATAARCRIPTRCAASRRSWARAATRSKRRARCCCARRTPSPTTRWCSPTTAPDAAEVLSGGNFHAEPVAFAADNLALAVAEIGALSERRIALLIDATLVGTAAVPRHGTAA